VRVVADKVERLVAGEPDEAYDAVFIDPPYAVTDERVRAVLEALTQRCSPRTRVVVVERSSRSAPIDWPEGLWPLAERR